ncbi:TetR/AcrR family transcriptional regulator [Paenisporosarcina cavernae]|uniref:TetR/AcrR family transcriptional regulator n=1 Tax=Paenisporosarcina cavernae TaxID=2320858 RepID=A0A385YXJ9_9BACL|nr:TetR/AcrR family transcriptional regulator [Paenisporosarcina cavernae]AYC30162.1 TetR/AcrR family transcriptional regulator [Paenisporosarcina cavernae]
MDRRKEILDAATRSFSIFGYKATTMDQVAKLANVGKGTIYTFFSTKEELFHEIVFSMIEEMTFEKDKVIDETKPFDENALAVLMKMLEFREKHALFAKLIQEEREMGTPIVQEALNQIERKIIGYIAEHLQLGIDREKMREVDVEIVSYLLLKSYLALAVEWQKTHESILSENQITRVFHDVIFKSLA